MNEIDRLYGLLRLPSSHRPIDLEDVIYISSENDITQADKIYRMGNRFFVVGDPRDICHQDEYGGEGESPYFNQESFNYNLFQARRKELTVELILEASRKQSTILDVACGDGLITNYLSARFADTTVIGVDVSMKALRLASSSESRAIFVAADAYDLPFVDNSYDCVVCNNAWEHFENPMIVARQAYRVLKPGGDFIVSTPSRFNLDNLWRVLRGRSIALQNPTYHVTEYTVGQLIEMLSWAGFITENIISKTIPTNDKSLKGRIRATLLRPIIDRYIKSVNSHHSLETTFFLRARKPA